ncbi:hypothetical protein [Klebsiella grimontii]|uniref:Uncharacterized protein n=1 Tax=Klebsiella grimontii TaxID=2058152 RepID=A0A839CGP5_9ENTR|nr:hypothetical protein [Klebsiella grimontii]BAS43443.1 hypothetical protein KOJKO3_c5429 [Klebsiella oxytoca]MBA8007464.1 hypothetical protein [Klebsiella grimontii]MBA8124230.1 hypothetical protein [Klebsiella grimontii]QLP39729.1 hypothetical protein HV112_00665 [Klebsiella grimontii]QLU54391.1 hypothetical protein HV114_00665 [Klebsiella grimontii]
MNIFNKVIVSKHSLNRSVNEANFSQNQLRSHCVSVRLNNDELQCLNAKRGDRSKGEWLRLAFLEKLPVTVPAINIEAWKSLSEISQKLNKLVAHLDNKSQGSSLTQTELFAVKRQISELRINLVGADLWGERNE